MTEVDSIKIPDNYLALAVSWSEGMGMLQAISSTGGLTIGTIPPKQCRDENFLVRKDWWYAIIWAELACELYQLIKHLREHNPKCKDLPELCEFEAWADNLSEKLNTEYNVKELW